MKNNILIKILFISILMLFQFPKANEITMLDTELNQPYDLAMQHIDIPYKNRLTKIQQKWLRYRSLQCLHSSSCRLKATTIQIDNLKSLVTGEINISSNPEFPFQFDKNGEVTQQSYEIVRKNMLNKYRKSLYILDDKTQKERQHAYELYNAYLLDYCSLLEQVTSVSFFNCQAKGMMDYQHEVLLNIHIHQP